MKYFSMFSGIGGFENGIERAYSRLARKRECNSSPPGGRKEVNSERVGLPQADRNMHNSVRSETTEDYPECIGYSEIDKYAKAIYRYHYPKHKNYGNAKDIIPESLLEFDLLVGGFPCQAFSIAGKRGGFDDTRGTLFFDVARILKAKRPEWFLLENVKGLCSHDSGKTLGTIYRVLADLGYTVGWEVVNSCQFGVPQNRERIFIVGHLTEAGGCIGEVLPVGRSNQGTPEGSEQTPVARCFTAGGNSGGMHSSMTLIADSGQDRKWEERDIAAPLRAGTAPGQHQKVVSGTWRTHKDGQGFRELDNPDISPCIPARAREDGSGQPVIKAVLTPERLEKRQNGRRFKENEEPSFTLTSQDKHGVQVGTKIRRLTPVECERLQGFPDGWTEYGDFSKFKSVTGNTPDKDIQEISDTQRYKCLGNAVTTNVITAFMHKIIPLVE